MTELTFGPFSVDMTTARVLRDGGEIRLRPRAFHALRVLLLHQGRSVGYEQMIAEAWEGTFVSRHTVDVTVSEVKKTLGEYGRWIVHRPKVGYSLEVPTSDELVRKGWHFWNRRTREGAELALDCFRQAADECPSDFRAFEGLSTCYLMLAVFGMRPPRDVYEEFLSAHHRAVEVGGLRPELRCNRAQGLHLFEGRLAEAEAELLQVMEEKPTFGTAYVRAALLYGAQGRHDEALAMVERGFQQEPLLPTLPATEVNVRLWRREFSQAVQPGENAVTLHPYLQISRANYAQALEHCGRVEEALAQYQLASIVSPALPWIRALEGTCLAKLGRQSEARAVLEELQALRRTEFVDAMYMASFLGSLGQTDEAFEELARACDENSAFMYAFEVDPRLDMFREDPRFERLRGVRVAARR